MNSIVQRVKRYLGVEFFALILSVIIVLVYSYFFLDSITPVIPISTVILALLFVPLSLFWLQRERNQIYSQLIELVGRFESSGAIRFAEEVDGEPSYRTLEQMSES